MRDEPVQLVLDRLRLSGHTPHKSGEGWVSTCPAHEDRAPSLSVGRGADGRALVYCHAGCENTAILAALGLSASELFPHDGPARGRVHPARRREKPKTMPALDWAAEHARFVAAVDPLMLESLSRELGVSDEALVSLGIGWASVERLGELCDAVRHRRGGEYKRPKSSAWVFPMMSGEGEIIGLNARAPGRGKWTVAGGRNGLFVPAGLSEMPDPVYVPEGASDTAAALSRGVAAVGRPSCSGGVEDLAVLLRGRRVILVGENDEKGDKWPGRDGARNTAAKLAHVWGVRSVEWILPPDGVKDLREWHRANPGKGLLADV